MRPHTGTRSSDGSWAADKLDRLGVTDRKSSYWACQPSVSDAHRMGTTLDQHVRGLAIRDGTGYRTIEHDVPLAVAIQYARQSSYPEPSSHCHQPLTLVEVSPQPRWTDAGWASTRAGSSGAVVSGRVASGRDRSPPAHPERATSIQASSGICDYASAGSLQSRCSRLRAGLAPELVGPPTIPDHVPRAGALRGCSSGSTLPLAGTPDLGRSPSQVLKRSKTGVAGP